jgi:Methyltransferase FkbM domain
MVNEMDLTVSSRHFLVVIGILRLLSLLPPTMTITPGLEEKLKTDATVIVRDADICYHVFLDVGANIGVHCQFLFEPDKYPAAQPSSDAFDRYFGKERDNCDFCCFEFEPNQKHIAALKNVSIAYSKQGWRFHIQNVGVSDVEEQKYFFHQGDEAQNEWGFSERQQNSDVVSLTVAQTTKVIRLSSWITQHLSSRIVPSSTFGNYSHGPRVVMKMDIEGSEYDVLPDLFSSGALGQNIDHLFGEFHGDIHGRFRQRLFERTFYIMLGAAKQCNTTFDKIVDESYLLDVIPLP